MENSPVFDFKVVRDEDRSFQSIEIYNDKIDERYSYDSKVPNHKNINIGSIVVIRDKEIIHGTSIIEDIKIVNGKKDLKYCPNPECNSYDISPRKTKRPKFKCKNGHEFDNPRTETIDVKKFTAFYSTNYISLKNQHLPISVLKDFYIKYNPTNSINRLKNDILKKLPIISQITSGAYKTYEIPSSEAQTFKENETEYLSSGTDERENVERQIKARRGQKKFRNDLRERYGDKCLITGCKILDILEAAHINPYRGANDNHPTNGLLLRSDIHTLFDLNLIGIEPNSLMIHVQERIGKEYEYIHLKRLLTKGNIKPEKKALENRWQDFVLRKFNELLD